MDSQKLYLIQQVGYQYPFSPLGDLIGEAYTLVEAEEQIEQYYKLNPNSQVVLSIKVIYSSVNRKLTSLN